MTRRPVTGVAPTTGGAAPADYDGFGPGNLPYGVDLAGHVVVAYGDKVIDLVALLCEELRPGKETVPLAGNISIDPGTFASGSLNAFMALGRPTWNATRRWLRHRLSDLPGRSVRDRKDVELVLPFEVADYVDFYSCEAHVAAMGRMLRPGEEPLPPAWRHIPMAYHGRSATVVVSGEAVPRPAGVASSRDSGPGYIPTRRLDVEVELGFVVGAGNRRGEPVPVEQAHQHIFGVVLVNDWSARDIQAFEYRPLGPFLGKSFATSVSPWVVPLEALAPWAVAGPPQDPEPAAYLKAPEPRGLDVSLELSLNGTVVSTSSSAGLYWSMAQQLAHITVNGAAARTGELFATGTISGTTPGTAGSLMELTSAGRDPIVLAGGAKRAWLEDGDEAVVRGWCGTPGVPGWISLGEVGGRVLPAGSSGVNYRTHPDIGEEMVRL
ncbi:MAG TPA: fumarylacetoacetase [Acidimicrobiales bacterium]|nr:fumarylacetoacetase [Acidimicrobiales bacterium]